MSRFVYGLHYSNILTTLNIVPITDSASEPRADCAMLPMPIDAFFHHFKDNGGSRYDAVHQRHFIRPTHRVHVLG